MGKPNWASRTLFHGDNLKFLRAMNSDSVDLIATDPPFNKVRDFHATPDSLASGARFQDRWSWERDVHQEWVDQITDDNPRVMNVIQGSRSSYGDDMGAFLCFMAVRLLAMRRVLKPTGSIYLHCDPTASHYLKELMDAVFGREELSRPDSEIFPTEARHVVDVHQIRRVDVQSHFRRKQCGYCRLQAMVWLLGRRAKHPRSEHASSGHTVCSIPKTVEAGERSRPRANRRRL